MEKINFKKTFKNIWAYRWIGKEKNHDTKIITLYILYQSITKGVSYMQEKYNEDEIKILKLQ
jgi:hypothetical protein